MYQCCEQHTQECKLNAGFACQVAQADGLAATESTIEMASAFGKAVDAKHMVLYRFKPGEQLPQVVAPNLQSDGSPP